MPCAAAHRSEPEAIGLRTGRARRPHGALALVACALLACCSTPELVEPRAREPAEPPRVLTSRGALSPARSEALLARQDKPSEPTLLARHLAVKL